MSMYFVSPSGNAPSRPTRALVPVPGTHLPTTSPRRSIPGARPRPASGTPSRKQESDQQRQTKDKPRTSLGVDPQAGHRQATAGESKDMLHALGPPYPGGALAKARTASTTSSQQSEAEFKLAELEAKLAAFNHKQSSPTRLRMPHNQAVLPSPSVNVPVPVPLLHTFSSSSPAPVTTTPITDGATFTVIDAELEAKLAARAFRTKQSSPPPVPSLLPMPLPHPSSPPVPAKFPTERTSFAVIEALYGDIRAADAERKTLEEAHKIARTKLDALYKVYHDVHAEEDKWAMTLQMVQQRTASHPRPSEGMTVEASEATVDRAVVDLQRQIERCRGEKRELKSNLDTKDRSWRAKEETLRVERDAMAIRVKEGTERLAMIKADLAGRHAELDKERMQREREEGVVQRRLVERTDEIEKLEKLSEERIRDALQDRQQRITAAQTEAEVLSNAIDGERRQRAELEKKHASVKDSCAELRHAMTERSGLRSRLNDLTRQADAWASEVSRWTSEVDVLRQTIAAKDAELDALTERSDTLSEGLLQARAIQSEVLAAKAELESRTQMLSDMHALLRGLEVEQDVKQRKARDEEQEAKARLLSHEDQAARAIEKMRSKYEREIKLRQTLSQKADALRREVQSVDGLLEDRMAEQLDFNRKAEEQRRQHELLAMQLVASLKD